MALTKLPHRVINSLVDSTHNWEFLRNIFPLSSEYILGNTAVSSLPASPINQQECYYIVDSTSLWHLKYRTTTNKWHFIGGASLSHEVGEAIGGASVNTTNTSYVDLTGGPTVTVPLAGTYEILFGAHSYNSGAAYAVMSVKLGGAATSDNQAAMIYGNSGVGIGTIVRGIRTGSLTASTEIKCQYRAFAAGTAHFYTRWLKVVPVLIDDI